MKSFYETVLEKTSQEECWVCGTPLTQHEKLKTGRTCSNCNSEVSFHEDKFVVPPNLIFSGQVSDNGDLLAQRYLAIQLERGKISEKEWKKGMDQIMDDMRRHDEEKHERLSKKTEEDRISARIKSYTPSR